MKLRIILCSAYLFLAFVAFKYVNEKLGLPTARGGFARWAQWKTVEAQSLDNALTLAENVPAKAEFSKRCSRPEVVRCFGFDNQAQTDPYIYPPSWQKVKRARVVQDIRASGNGSLRFEVPSGSGANTSGSFWLNFSDNFKIQFGENSEFYVQWVQRFSQEFLGTTYRNGVGWKQAIIGTGDQPGKHYSSCTDLEVVVQNTYQRGFAQLYNSCSGSTSHRGYDPFQQNYAAGDFKLQNARQSPYCLYSQAASQTYFPPNGNCFGYVANEWLTFQMHFKLGPRVGDEFVNSYVTMWIGREGQPSEEVFNWGPYNLSAGSRMADQKFGKIWFLPYHTGKDFSQIHPTGYVWYDELVISRKKIQDPELNPAR